MQDLRSNEEEEEEAFCYKESDKSFIRTLQFGTYWRIQKRDGFENVHDAHKV